MFPSFADDQNPGMFTQGEQEPDEPEERLDNEEVALPPQREDTGSFVSPDFGVISFEDSEPRPPRPLNESQQRISGEGARGNQPGAPPQDASGGAAGAAGVAGNEGITIVLNELLNEMKLLHVATARSNLLLQSIKDDGLTLSI